MYTKNKYIFLLLVTCVFMFGLFFVNTSFLLETSPNPQQVARKYFEVIKAKYFRDNGMIESEKNKTTSESQSYMMLMAVMSSDRQTFDRVWDWTKSNLQLRPKDKLFAWLWKDGKIADINPATDADQDIAYALYLAHKRWGNEAYLNQAREIVRDIWNIETKEIAGERYVAAGNWATKYTDGVVVNPSYLAPYQYRAFATFNTENDWLSLADSSYKALELCSSSMGLPMDWCKIDNQGNLVKNFKFGNGDSSKYSYDALRVPFRIAMDYALYAEPRALEYLKRNNVFAENWKEQGKIFAVYNQQGEPLVNYESFANYGTQLASMSLTNKELADEIFKKKIVAVDSLYNLGFYNLSWLWFGLRFSGDGLGKN